MNTAQLVREIVEEARAILEPRDGRDVDPEELELRVRLIIAERELQLEEDAFLACRPDPGSIACEPITVNLGSGRRLQLRGLAFRKDFGRGWERWACHALPDHLQRKMFA